MDAACTEQEFLLDTCEQKVHIEELFGLLIFLAKLKAGTKEECKVIAAPPGTITCDECGRNKKRIGRLLGLGLID